MLVILAGDLVGKSCLNPRLSSSREVAGSTFKPLTQISLIRTNDDILTFLCLLVLFLN